MLRKQRGMGRMAAEWVPGGQSKLSLFFPEDQWLSFPILFSVVLGSQGTPRCWLAFGMKTLFTYSSVEEERCHLVPTPASFALPECVSVMFLSPFLVCPLLSSQYEAAAGLNESA